MIDSIFSILYTARTARIPQSLLTVLFMETQLMPIQSTDVATAPCLRSAQCLHLSYHPFPFSSLHQCLFPMPPSVFCEGDSLWLQQNCRLFRAIVLSKCDFWDMEKPGISWSLIPVLSLHWSPALLRDLRALDTEKPNIREIHFHDVFCLGRKSFVFT